MQIMQGLLCGALNIALYRLCVALKLPFFLDTLFTVTASMFGVVSGVIAALLYHSVGAVLSGDMLGFLFVICSLSAIVVVRIFVRNYGELDVMQVLQLAMIIALVISVEGSLVFTYIFSRFGYSEDAITGTLSYLLVKSRLPLLLSAFLARIPVNLLDKAVCVFGGWGIALLFKRLGKRLHA